MAIRQYGLVLSGMTLHRCHEPDSAVTMLMVVPLHEAVHPLLSCREISKAIGRIPLCQPSCPVGIFA